MGRRMDAKTFKWIADRLVDRLDQQNRILDRIARAIEARAQPLGTFGPLVVGPVDFTKGGGGGGTSEQSPPCTTTFSSGPYGGTGRCLSEAPSSNGTPQSK